MPKRQSYAPARFWRMPFYPSHLLKLTRIRATVTSNCRYLNKARAQCRQAGAVLFEKFRGDMDERDDIATEFAAIDDRYGGHFDWKLV
ncbi:hypothetical protein COOONC_21173 [Cooperia oncophora]